jgi:hypothetical protein
MQQISDLNLKILLSQRLMGLVRKKIWLGLLPTKRVHHLRKERDSFAVKLQKRLCR